MLDGTCVLLGWVTFGSTIDTVGGPSVFLNGIGGDFCTLFIYGRMRDSVDIVGDIFSNGWTLYFSALKVI